ncbi:MAG TPA: bacteriohopanetetrol glucosamine biosynthesis glycosyltransferase HpnI [Candidatus Sulfotelmatobacter sp.]|nr:bacteriohopanetetrol glucosamine biosynthesis glycosyltransferase HpnI [Candidatus Sulfotelmatobacter sp.]
MALLALVLAVLTAASALYWLWALSCACRFGRRTQETAGFLPPVTILKPLQGDDGYLYENLRSFCRQAYPTYQLVFGVRDAADPAAAVVERVQAEFPAIDMALVIGGPDWGANRKISTVINLLRQARHEVVVLVDSDMRVTPDYLGQIVAPLADPAVGMVTCLYKGTGAGVASTLGAMFINEWFLPSALAGIMLQELRHAFGATMAFRRETLAAIGGFEAVADYLADDYMLGWLVSRRGLRVVLSPYIVENVVAEAGVAGLVLHELRWTRTVRNVRPASYFSSVVTHGLPLALGLLLLAGATPLAVGLLLAHLGLRCGGRLLLYPRLGLPVPWRSSWLVPIRDLLSFMLWALSFLGGTVRWNGERLQLRSDGTLAPALRDEGRGAKGSAQACAGQTEGPGLNDGQRSPWR